MFKYSMTESNQWNYARQTRTSYVNMTSQVYSIEYLMIQIELVMPTFFQLLDRSQNDRIFNVTAIV